AAAVIARESAFNKNAISSTGAKGLGQIKNFNFKSLKINDPYDIKQNVSGTTSYLKRMLSKWKDQSNNVSLALASYYKGYTNVKKGGGKLDKKTSGYVNDILDYYKDLEDLRTTEDRSD
ncbi:MAG: soluble lytic murein transglycosylase-like protein, partial [Candidatus Marinamargulisbacteria bacterium]